MNEGAERSFISDPGNGEDRSTDEIMHDIERRRESIARTVDQAGQKVQESLNWKEQVRAHPYGALALATCAVFATVRLLRHGTTPVERLTATLSDNVDGVGTSLRRSIDALGRTQSRPIAPIVRTLATTLAAIAARSLVQTVRRAVVEEPQPNHIEQPQPNHHMEGEHHAV